MDKENFIHYLYTVTLLCVCVCVCVYIYIERERDRETERQRDRETERMEYYSSLKKKEILPFVTWMNLEGIMLSEINQTYQTLQTSLPLYLLTKKKGGSERYYSEE